MSSTKALKEITLKEWWRILSVGGRRGERGEENERNKCRDRW